MTNQANLPPFNLRWRNFHGFEDTGMVYIRPLTLLIGPNNSGKSSLLKPLLIMKQTTRTFRNYPALVTRGELVNVGEFSDYVTGGDVALNVEFDLSFHTHEPEDPARLEHVGHYPPGACVVSFSQDSDLGVVVERFDVYDTYRRRMYRRVRRENNSYSLLGLPVRGKGRDKKSVVDLAVRRRIRSAKPEHFLFTGAPLFSNALQDVSHDQLDQIDEIELSEFSSEYLRITDYTYSGVRRLLSSLKHLGPLREYPRRLYEVQGEPPADIGVRGEHAPELLFVNQDEQFNLDMQKWLEHFGLPKYIERHSLGEGAFSLAFKSSQGSPAVNFTDLGFGASQILPLIVQALRTRDNEILITEQPEIHLNPRLQAALADLFSAIVIQGGGAIVETHSEHLLTRVRRLVASGHIDANDVAIYFVERSDKGLSTIRPVELQRNGDISAEDWPAGFFADALRESMALASAQREGLD